MKFLKDDGQGQPSFEAQRFAKVVELVVTADGHPICSADFLTQKIGENTAPSASSASATPTSRPADGDRPRLRLRRRPRPGRCHHLPDDRHRYRRSAELAAIVGPYYGYARNAQPHLRVMKQHSDENAQGRPHGRPGHAGLGRLAAERALNG
ncbi:hypothetical protein LV779_05905 [Streptomyces thinghirensis]|nr:hypothetical protein [Streptomyces thinghirensis]